MNIAVFGLGYVGIVNIACLSELGHSLWGCDIKSHKVDLLKEGKCPIYEPQVDEMLKKGVAEKRIHASVSAAEVVKHTDLALICVGTPSRADGTVNLDYTINTTLELARCIREKGKKFTLIFRSTIPPGTMENELIPLLRRELGDHADLAEVVFIPEFLREGSAVRDFFQCSRIVAGTEHGENEVVSSLFGFSNEVPLVFTDMRTAEFVKYVDNAFHALKIAFVNEAYRIGSACGADVQKANEVFLMDKHLNIAETYLRPGLPFGGSCLPKDLRAIGQMARSRQIQTPLLDTILTSNHIQLDEMYRLIFETGAMRIGLYGLTFKSGTDDVRESPMVLLSKKLIRSGVSLSIYDPDVNLLNLRIEQPEIVRHVVADPATAFGNAEVVVVCKKGFLPMLKDVSPDARLFNFYDQQRFDTTHVQQTLY